MSKAKTASVDTIQLPDDDDDGLAGEITAHAAQVANVHSNAPPSALPVDPGTVSAAVKTIAAARSTLLQEAERIIWLRLERVDCNRWHGNVRAAFHPRELAVFDTLAWDTLTIQKEAGRLQTVKANLAIAGTLGQQAAARAAAATAKQRLAKEGPALEEKIAAFEAELAALRRANATAAQDVERRENAMQALTRLVAPNVKEEFEQRVNGARQRLAPLIMETQNRIKTIQYFDQFDPTNGPMIRDNLVVLQTWFPELIGYPPGQYHLSIRNPPEFKQAVEKLKAELSDLQTRVERYQAQLEAELVDAQKLLTDGWHKE